MTAHGGGNRTDSLDIVFAVLALLLVTGTILIAIGGVYYSLYTPRFKRQPPSEKLYSPTWSIVF